MFIISFLSSANSLFWKYVWVWRIQTRVSLFLLYICISTKQYHIFLWEWQSSSYTVSFVMRVRHGLDFCIRHLYETPLWKYSLDDFSKVLSFLLDVSNEFRLQLTYGPFMALSRLRTCSTRMTLNVFLLKS